MGHAALKTEQQGFVGAISGLSLADIVQIKGDNLYSGCLVVEHNGKNGIIYFREGDVVHAEQGGLEGEEAFYAVMGWVGGTFRSEPKISTTRRTIDQALKFLILEAFCRMDEVNNGSQQERPMQSKSRQEQQVESSYSREGAGMNDVSAKLSVIPEIEQALVITKDGVPVDDASYEAQHLGANGLFLAIFANKIGSQFGVGDLKAATVHGIDHHLFLFDSKRHHLCISAKGSANVTSLDSEIRRVVAQR